MGYSLNVVATEYRLIDNYTNRLDRIGSSTRNFANKVEDALAMTIRLGAAMGVAAAGGLIQLGVAAVKAYADFEQLTVTMTALTGSAERAAQKLAFVRKLAIPATETFPKLAEAAVQLEAFGLRAEAILPTITKLAAAMKSNPQALQEAVRIFGEAASGRILLTRQLAAVGLSKGQLEREGLQFDKGGRLLSSANETLDALKRVVEHKYGDILDKMAGTTNAKLTNLQNSWQMLLIKIGEALTKYALPAMEKLTHAIDALSKSQGFDKFLQRLAHNFIIFVLQIAQALAFMELALGFLRLAMKDFVGAALAFTAAAAITLGSGVFAKGARDLLKSLKVGGMSGKVEVPTDPNPALGNYEPGQQPDNTQEKIERNTRITAESMSSFTADLRRYVVGGGELASMGITPVELGAIKGDKGGRGGITVNAPGATKKLQSALQEIAESVYHEVNRQQPWGHTRFAHTP